MPYLQGNMENGSSTRYVTELCRLAANSKYSADTHSIVLFDVFVSGLRSRVILERLFQENDPTFEAVVTIAMSIE